jgi:AhpD family alkylhydroperoxidase
MESGLKTLTSPGYYFILLKNTVVSMFKLLIIPGDQKISRDFGEKIFLAVCGVNKCLYCTWLHTKTALETGLDETEINKILSGDFKNIRDGEAVAVLYAQHWADSKGDVSIEARQRVVKKYGKYKTTHIEANINVVYFGNLCSNTVYSYQNGTIANKDRITVFITYMLALPVAYFIKKSSGKK